MWPSSDCFNYFSNIFIITIHRKLKFLSREGFYSANSDQIAADWFYTISFFLSGDSESIECYIEDQAVSLSYDLAPPHPLPPQVSKLSLFLSLYVCRRSSLLTGRGGRDREEPNQANDGKKAWFYINRSILSEVTVFSAVFWCIMTLWMLPRMRMVVGGGGDLSWWSANRHLAYW